MAESKQRQRLNGAVLIMVLTVMVVLIIMLMATLTVVTTANQRIYTKFEENQAYYTARSALDIFTEKMLNDDGYYAYDPATSAVRTYSQTNSDVTGTDTHKMKQGLALQSELYKIKSKGDATMEIAKSLDGSLTDENARKILSFAENMYQTDDVFGTVGGFEAPEDEFYTVSTIAINDETEAAKQQDYIEYQITFPKVADSSDSYGRMVDTDAVTGEQLATIRVEVIDRVYAPYTPADRTTLINTMKSGTQEEKDAVKAAIKSGNRSKDYMRLKITSTVQFMDTEATAVLYYDTYTIETAPSSRSVTSLSDLSDGSGLFPVGGAAALYEGEIIFDQNSVVTGDIYLKGSFFDGQTSAFYIDGTTMWYAAGNLKFTQPLPTAKSAGAVLYAGDTLYINNSSALGSVGNEVNLVGKTVKFGSNAEKKIYGNVYCEVLDLTEANNSNLHINGNVYAETVVCTVPTYGWEPYGVVNKTITIGGDIDDPTQLLTIACQYQNDIADNVYFNNFVLDYVIDSHGIDIYGSDYWIESIRIKYDVKNKTVTSVDRVKTDFDREFVNYVPQVVNTTTTVLYNYPMVAVDYFNSVDGVAPTSMSDSIDLDLMSYPLDSEMKRTVVLPTEVKLIPAPGENAKNEIVVSTPQAIYGDYLKPDAFDANGEIAYPVTAITDADKWAFIDSNVITAEEKANLSDFNMYSASDTVTIESVPANDPDISASEFAGVIKSGGRLQTCDFNANGGIKGKYAIDARSSAIVIQLSGNEYSPTDEVYHSGQFVVFGDNPVTFLVAGKATVYMGAPNNNGDFQIFSEEIYNVYKNGGILALGNCAVPTAAPNINIYVASTVPRLVYDTGNITCGYLYMPKTSFETSEDGHGIPFNTAYNGYSIGSQEFSVIGSVFCKSYKTGNIKTGVAFVDPGATGGDPEDPHLDWQVYRYART